MNPEQASKLARRFVELPAEKRSLFLDALRREEVDFALFPIPSSEGVAGRDRLSFAQQRMWFLWQLDPQSAGYNLPLSVCLDGELDITALERAFSLLVERHESLRTTFFQDDEQVWQRIAPPSPVSIEVRDLHQVAEPQRWAQAQEHMRSEASQAFDLEHGPLMRVLLLRIDATRHVLLLTLHHIITDGWSMGVLLDECLGCYDDLTQGRQPQLAPLPVQYRDYALWQRAWLEAGEQTRQLEYWRGHLGAEHPVLDLPTDHPHPVVPGQQGKRLEIALDRALLKSLQSVAQGQGVTLFVLLLASFKVLLHRYSGQTDIRVGGLIANRNRSETEGLIGFFVNTQVLRSEVRSDMRFAELLDSVRETALGAQSHQELPFDVLVDGLQVVRGQNRNPLFQAMYNHRPQVAETGARQLASGLQVESLSPEQLGTDDRAQAIACDLMLETCGEGDQLSASFTYATELFDAATIERLAGHWRNLLQGICADAGQRIAALPLLDAAERQQILVDWNQSTAEYPREHCLPALIEAQVRATPQATALVLGGASLSYAQLNSRANQLAHKLRELGVGADVLVGVALERSLEMVVGLLAILKAGGAYVPLDPDFPRDRLAYMMEDSGLKLLLTQTSLVQQLPIPGGVQSLCLDQDGDWLDGYSTDDLPALAAPENLAYVIYTSGSTGLPKGVTIQHQALVNFLSSMADKPGLSAEDRVLSLTSLSFDIAGLELYLPLLRGAAVVLLDTHQNKDPQALLQVIAEQGVTVIQATPSSWRMILDAAPAGALAGKTILCGGEALSAELAQRLIEQAGHVWNVYGPTETTIWSARHYLTESDDVWLGKPLANTTLHIISDDLDVLPVGARGELLIGGDGLARGYHQRPSLTAQRFIPDPFGGNGGRLYRTGDLARYKADGVIEYAGRLDHQVKIRGFRIELGEIEARLLEHPAVHEAVVIDIDAAGGKQLAAYLVASDSSANTDQLRSELKAHLKAGLPDYMVPSHLVWLPAMPQTPNGKLDRKALPAPDASVLQHTYVAPVSELEQQLAAIWAEVLKIERVGLGDSFFELGGHSLLAAQMIARIKKQLGISLPLRTLFEKPLLSELVAEVAALTTTTTDDDWDDMDQFMDSLEELGA